MHGSAWPVLPFEWSLQRCFKEVPFNLELHFSIERSFFSSCWQHWRCGYIPQQPAEGSNDGCLECVSVYVCLCVWLGGRGGQPNPCDYCVILSRISCASWRRCESLRHHSGRCRLLHVCSLRFIAICLKHWLASLCFPLDISTLALVGAHPSSLHPLGGWGRGGEEISGDYHRLENTDGFVCHLSSRTLCQPAVH